MKQRILLERAALLALLLLLFTSTALFAQQAGSLRGQVSDQSGGVIPGATVTITKAGVASAERATQVTGEGVYQFDNVAPGAYTVKVSAAGFAPLQKDDVVIAAGKRTALDITLEVTLEKQKVEVVSEPPVSVEADNNANAVVLKEKDMEALPDDPDELSDVLQAMAGPSAGPNGGQFFIDGFTGATLPPKEAIREIRINSNPFSSEYDRLGFGRIEIFTKPGMDKFHGSANFNYTDDNLNTRFPYVSNRPSYMRRMYNGNLTGPLLKNRASFFVSFSGRQIDDNAAVVATILDPNFNVTSFQQAVVTPQRRYETNARLDLKLNDKNTLVASYSYETNSQSGQGVSGFSLPTWNGVSRAFSTDSGEQSIRATETMIVNPTTINETRFQFMYPNSHRASGGVGPQISVSGAFTGGGTGFTDIFNNSDRFELQNYTTKAFAKHSLKFGVRLRGDTQDDYSASNFNGNYIFSGVQNAPVLDASNQVVPGAFASITSIEQYRRTVLFQSLGFTPTQIRALGGMPNQLTLNAGNPDMGVNQVDAGVFAQDDWRFRSNLTISTGLRYEQQTNISSNFNFAPRIAFAWSPSAKGMAGKTVVRGGFGIFYDRIGEGTTLNTLRYNGVNEQAFLVQPTSQTLGQTGASLLNLFPALPSVSALSQFAQGGTLYRLQNGAQAPYNVVASVSVERTLPKNVVVSTSYIRSRFVHMQMERNINAPLPGTVTSSNPSGILPYGNAGNLYEYETAGMYEQNQLLFSVNERFTRNFNLFSWYTYSRARSNTDGGFPSNMYDVNADWGRASGDMRHRLFVGGSVTLPKGVTLFPLINIHSGSPFNITSGLDPLVNGLSGFTERPAFAPNLSAPGMKVTPYGAFILNPGTGQAMIPRNYGEGPGFIGVNLRIAKSFGVGPKIESAQNSQQGRDRQQRMMTGGAGGPGGGGGGPRGGGGGGMRGGGGPGGGPGGFGGGGNSGRRYTLTVSANAENILNHVNAGNPIGNLSSPLFGQSQTLAGGGGFGGGGNSAAGNRRIDLQIRFNF